MIWSIIVLKKSFDFFECIVQRTGAFTFMKEDMPKTKSILHVVVAWGGK